MGSCSSGVFGGYVPGVLSSCHFVGLRAFSMLCSVVGYGFIGVSYVPSFLVDSAMWGVYSKGPLGYSRVSAGSSLFGSLYSVFDGSMGDPVLSTFSGSNVSGRGGFSFLVRCVILAFSGLVGREEVLLLSRVFSAV